MAKRKKGLSEDSTTNIEDYRHRSAKRKNNPPAALASAAPVPVVPKASYAYNPHLPPVLRFDPAGGADKLPSLIEKATHEKLTPDEARLLADALRSHEPWLEWTTKRERKSFEVDPVALHIHERISAQAILKVAARQDVERNLFGDPQQAYHEAVQFYRHDVDWTNRLILGDSLSVMSSLARREDLSGKVQMIYLDPPYGIKFASNFQPEIGRRDVKDKEQDLTREPEMVRAYRDTWQLGIHSYLSYLRDRLIITKDLLADSGSIFVQISDENLHRVKQLMDEVFGKDNFIAQINFKSMGALGQSDIPKTYDYLLWFTRNHEQFKFRPLYKQQSFDDDPEYRYSEYFAPDKLYRRSTLTSSGFTSSCTFPFEFNGQSFQPFSNKSWRTNQAGMKRLTRADRVFILGGNIYLKRFAEDSAVMPYENSWTDPPTAFVREYVVQTPTKFIERCMLMTTDPGDLVLDPTCGSGTTAYVAEQWGRRWITVDTSRVAVSIARQRLLTAKFDYYKTKLPEGVDAEDPNGNPARGFNYKTVPHITLKSIAQNVALDPIFAKHEPILESKLTACNEALKKVGKDLADKLEAKLIAKQKRDGKKSVTDADRRRWLLPPLNRDKSAESKKRITVDLEAKHWYSWEVPFDTDPDWPKALADAVIDYRKAWRAKMDEVNACIAASAEQEELVDQPEVVKGVVRVSGPFTVEAVQPPEMSLGDELPVSGFDGEPEKLEGGFSVRPVVAGVGQTPQDIAAYLDKMIKLLRMDGVRFPNNKQMVFSRLDPTYENRQSTTFHAEGRWHAAGETDAEPDGPSNVVVVIGPQYGSVTAPMVEKLIKPASRKYDDLVVAGFSFDAESYNIFSESEKKELPIRLHVAHIRPDVNPAMDGLLKDSPGGQLFTVFGLPRVNVSGPNEENEYTVEMEGVDVYNPVDNTIQATGADKVAAWFLDGDYDGRTFCVTQAFFPDRGAWEKLAKALGGTVDPDRFEALSGTTSLPFPAGKHKCVAVKVIDPRGNEVMSVHELG